MASPKKNDDLELGGVMKDTSLTNDVVQNYTWRDINVQVKDRVRSDPLSILLNTNCIVHAGEMIASALINQEIEDVISKAKQAGTSVPQLSDIHVQKPHGWTIPLVLLQRAWIKSYRDIVAYGIRVSMYLGNGYSHGSAFMSFTAVAYVLVYLEDQATFYKERANGIVGPLALMISNFIIGLPFLFFIGLLFSVVEYWLTGFRASGTGFMTFLMWLFLDLVAAESLVVLVSSVFPVFVVALAVTAFANGLWMCICLQGMMVNEFKHRTYSCGKTAAGQYQCAYESSLNSEDMIASVDVLKNYDINANKMGKWVGIIISIIIIYRVLGYLALRFRQG
ncbi:ATP-binding cassette transporter [Talaromyces pinophilus]|uniref:ATP-binding cassette transporter n=1 Tax=Talaromyces pinophilus TaxID=128442 RepID=A0A6V8HJ05_TALPI|nr:ATP-binding cassette transporter [Talaromyces pinophilus]